MKHILAFEKHVFVYGTLKNPNLTRKVLGHYAPYKTETVEGEKETIHTYPNLIPKKDHHQVKGHELEVDDQDIKKLDQWEEKYKRKKVKLNDHDLSYYYRLKRNQFRKNEMQSIDFEEQLEKDLPNSKLTIEIPSTGTMLAQFGGKCLIMLDGEEIGHFSIDSVVGGETKLWNFLIYDGYKNKGYGSKALKAIEALLRRINVRTLKLGVVLSNIRAQKFYQKNGYKVLSDYESSFENVIWYYKNLLDQWIAQKN